MISEADTERCASENAGSPREVKCEILHRLDRRMKYHL